MQDALGYCEQLVREADKDRFLASLFVAEGARADLFALYAFNAEVARVRESIHQPLPGEIRLQWWRDVINRQREAEAAAHPVASALLEVIQRHDLPTMQLLDVIDARSFDLYDEPMLTLPDLETYAAQTSSSILALAVRILGGGEGQAIEQATYHAGVAYALAGLLRAFPVHAARGQSYIPRDVLVRHGADPHDVFSGRATPPVRAALAEVRGHARAHLSATRTFVASVPEIARIAFLPVALTAPALRHMERRKYDPFVPDELPQWRRQWTLWRASSHIETAL